MTAPAVEVALSPPAEHWPCSWEECPRPAAYAITFHGQVGHVHDCVQHTAVLREWSDVDRVVGLPCPFPHGETTWTDTPADLGVDPSWRADP